MHEKQETAADRLSCLPNEIIVRIMSLLSLKEAVSTSLLSTRWKHLWALVPNLFFAEKMFSKRSLFLDFVGRALALRAESSLREFSLTCDVLEDTSLIMKWIDTALKRNPQCLYLHLTNSCSPYSLPSSIFECGTLEKFQLKSSCVLILPPSTSLPNLKVLSLSEVMFVDDDSVKRLFSCPSLLSLSIEGCKWKKLHHICISAPKLQYLCIDDYLEEFMDNNQFLYEDIFAYDRQIEMNGASLKSFVYEGELINEYKISGIDRQLVEAEIHVNFHPRDVDTDIVVSHGYRLLSAVSNVKVLILTPDFLEDLANNVEVLRTLPRFSHMTELKIDGEIDSLAFQVLCIILRRSPRLRRLVIGGFEHDSRNEDHGWLLDPVPSCFVTGLKEISFCIPYKESLDEDLLILGQLLDSAVAMEKMEIYYRKDLLDTELLKDRLAMLPVGSKEFEFSLFGTSFHHSITTDSFQISFASSVVAMESLRIIPAPSEGSTPSCGGDESSSADC